MLCKEVLIELRLHYIFFQFYLILLQISIINLWFSNIFSTFVNKLKNVSLKI